MMVMLWLLHNPTVYNRPLIKLPVYSIILIIYFRLMVYIVTCTVYIVWSVSTALSACKINMEEVDDPWTMQLLVSNFVT